MAIRNIRTIGDPVLNKKCKEVKEMTPRIQELIDDMFDTMYEANGVGLAAPQVGILKRIVVIDTTGEDPIVMINPRIIETSGEQTGGEGCLSVPGRFYRPRGGLRGSAVWESAVGIWRPGPSAPCSKGQTGRWTGTYIVVVTK